MSESHSTSPSAGGDDRLNLERAYQRHICRAASLGNWAEASLYDGIQPNWFCTPLTEDGDTALHIAVSMERTSFVVELVQRMSVQDTEILNADGNTAFCMAAISGNVKIATILLRKNSRLAWIRGHHDMLPIHLAISAAQPHMAKFLFGRTQQDMHIYLSSHSQDILELFFLALTHRIYLVASILLDKNRRLVSAVNEEGLTALEVLAQLSFEEDARGYRHILRSLFKIMKEEEFPNSVRTSKAMFDAAESGNMLILKFILEYYPNLLMKKNLEGQTLLHIAILHRQEPVYQLILSKGAYKNAIMQEVDFEGNNVLHLAGKFPIQRRVASPINHDLIHTEEMWFKEVERMVPPTLKTMRNIEGLTPPELFLREHKELSENSISNLNQMANTFLVVATLIVTLGITGALTIRTNNIQGQTLVFSQKTWYIIFLLSVAIGIALCAISMLFFTSAILRSVLKQEGVGDVSSRLLRVIHGCLLLLLSVAVMAAVSATSGAALVYNFIPKWILYSIAALVGIGVISFWIIYWIYVSCIVQFLLAHCEKAAQIILSMVGIKWGRVMVARPLLWYKVRTG